jgi:putative SOS response-associated peptidase YedK
MCGRFALDKKMDDLIRDFTVTTGLPPAEWEPSWNVSPTQEVPVVREREGERELALVRWGAVAPSSPTFGGKPIFNARIETVASNGLFKGPFASHRCIVPANGYYEWQLQEHGKRPFYISEPGVDLAMAGVIRPWADRSKPKDDPAYWRLSMAIITRDAHVAPGEVHDRMPVCLTEDSYDDWLGDRLDPDHLLDLLDHTSLLVAHQLDFREVSTDVNSSRNDGPQLIEAI